MAPSVAAAAPTSSQPSSARCPDSSAEPEKRAAAPFSPEQLRRRSRTFLDTLRRKVGRMVAASPLQPPDQAVMRLSDYMFAWSEALGEAPEFIDALAEQIENGVCQIEEEQGRDTMLMMYARLVRIMPELASERTFDCYFAVAKREDHALWEGIAAWKKSEFPMPDALEGLAQSATKPQTRYHLKSEAEIAREMEPGPALDARGLPLPGQIVAPPGGKLGFPPGTL